MTTDVWWRCRHCSLDFFDSAAVHLHRRETGHVGATLCADDVPPPGISTERARRAAIEATRRAVDEAKRKRLAAYGEGL